MCCWGPQRVECDTHAAGQCHTLPLCRCKRRSESAAKPSGASHMAQSAFACMLSNAVSWYANVPDTSGPAANARLHASGTPTGKDIGKPTSELSRSCVCTAGTVEPPFVADRGHCVGASSVSREQRAGTPTGWTRHTTWAAHHQAAQGQRAAGQCVGHPHRYHCESATDTHATASPGRKGSVSWSCVDATRETGEPR